MDVFLIGVIGLKRKKKNQAHREGGGPKQENPREAYKP